MRNELAKRLDEIERKKRELNLPALTELMLALDEDMDGGKKAGGNYEIALAEAAERGYSDAQFADMLDCTIGYLTLLGWDNEACYTIDPMHEKFMKRRRGET